MLEGPRADTDQDEFRRDRDQTGVAVVDGPTARVS